MTNSIFGASTQRPEVTAPSAAQAQPTLIWGARPSQPPCSLASRFAHTDSASALEAALASAVGGDVRDLHWFTIMDHVDAIGATHLLCNDDYADEYETGLPTRAEPRFEMLTSLVGSILLRCPNATVGIALTDAFQVERVRHTDRSTFASTMHNDFIEQSPSDTIYVID